MSRFARVLAAVWAFFDRHPVLFVFLYMTACGTLIVLLTSGADLLRLGAAQ